MNLKKLLSLALSGVLVLSLAVPALAAEETITTDDGPMPISVTALEETAENAGALLTTTDRASNAPWYAEAQAYVTEKGIMTGTDKGFEPEIATDRASVFQTLYNLEGKPAVTSTATFTDVAGKWFANTAAWAETQKLSTGDENRAFNGEGTATRAEVAVIFTRYSVLKGSLSVAENDSMKNVPDYGTIPGWALDGMTFCYDAGLMTGDENGNLNPTAAVTRAQLATMLMRFDKLAEESRVNTAENIVIESLEMFDKYGDAKLSVTSGDLAKTGVEYADYVTLKFLDQEVTLPVVPQYRYVGSKAAGLVMWEDGTKPVELEIFNGSFAETYGLATKHTAEDKSFTYTANEGVEFPVAVTIEIAEKGGYADTYAIFDLIRTDDRSDYEGLSDAQFANFRMVTTTGLGRGKLYRASSPVNPSIGRSEYADKAAQSAGVKSFVNLADSEESAAKYAGYADSYYSKQDILFLNLGVDFATEANRKGVADTMEFIADAKTPVLVHCNEGQDRAGFVSAILECLMGASFPEVKQDYMATFYNYYGVTAGTDQYGQIANNIIKNLKAAFNVEDLYKADLSKEAEEYLKELGVSAATIANLKKNLGGETVTVTGKVTEIEKYGHALLDVKIADFNKAGFALGDVVTVCAGSYTDNMPYFDGYYVDKGEYMLRAYPSHEYIGVCINYGKFAETAGIGVGDTVRITLAGKGGALATQEINNLVYTNDPKDYASDEVFANFREVALGGIGAGKLYRSASPVNNENKRAAAANKLAEGAKVAAVMNLADTDEEIKGYFEAEGFASSYYKSLYEGGKVIALAMPVNFSSDEFAEGIVKGLTFLSEHEGPYLVHCTEGKDRAGFTAMLLEALMGAKPEDIVADYMLSYVNYYHLDPGKDAEKYEMLAEKNVKEMLRAVAGLEKGASLEGVDLAAAAERYLTSHGMTEASLSALKANLR